MQEVVNELMRPAVNAAKPFAASFFIKGNAQCLSANVCASSVAVDKCCRVSTFDEELATDLDRDVHTL